MASKKTSAADEFDEQRADRNLGAAASLTEALRPNRNLAEAVLPSGLRTILDAQRSIKKLVSPLDRLGLGDQPDAFKSLRANRFGLNIQPDAFESLRADRFGLGRFAHADLLRTTALHSQFGDMTRLLEVGKLTASGTVRETDGRDGHHKAENSASRARGYVAVRSVLPPCSQGPSV